MRNTILLQYKIKQKKKKSELTLCFVLKTKNPLGFTMCSDSMQFLELYLFTTYGVSRGKNT